MSHHLQGIIARTGTLRVLGGVFVAQPRFALTSDFAFLPLDATNLDEILPPSQESALPEFFHLTSALQAYLQSASSNGELAYIETEYFGGVGGQGAMLARNGAVALGPVWREDAVNQVLSELGAPHKLGSRDLFESLNLHRYRHNDDVRHSAERL